VSIVRELRASFVHVNANDGALVVKVLPEQLYRSTFLHTNLKGGKLQDGIGHTVTVHIIFEARNLQNVTCRRLIRPQERVVPVEVIVGNDCSLQMTIEMMREAA
jgi:hypothetical protein